MCEKMRQLAEKRAWQINELQRKNHELRTMYDELMQQYNALKIEQQKDKALWMALASPPEEKLGGTSDESGSPIKTEPEHNERPVPRHWRGPC